MNVFLEACSVSATRALCARRRSRFLVGCSPSSPRHQRVGRDPPHPGRSLLLCLILVGCSGAYVVKARFIVSTFAFFAVSCGQTRFYGCTHSLNIILWPHLSSTQQKLWVGHDSAEPSLSVQSLDVLVRRHWRHFVFQSDPSHVDNSVNMHGIPFFVEPSKTAQQSQDDWHVWPRAQSTAQDTNDGRSPSCNYRTTHKLLADSPLRQGAFDLAEGVAAPRPCFVGTSEFLVQRYVLDIFMTSSPTTGSRNMFVCERQTLNRGAKRTIPVAHGQQTRHCVLRLQDGSTVAPSDNTLSV